MEMLKMHPATYKRQGDVQVTIDQASRALLILNVFSLCSSTIIIYCIIYGRIRAKRFSNYITFRISGWIAVVNTIYHGLFIVLYINPNSEKIGKAGALIILWLLKSMMLCSVLLYCVIGLCLQSITINAAKYDPAKNWWHEYVVIVFSLLIELPSIFLFDDAVYMRKYGVFMVYAEESWKYLVSNWICYYGVLGFAVLYNILASIQVGISLSPLAKKTRFLSGSTGFSGFYNSVHISKEAAEKSRNAIRWLSLYPIIPIVTQIFPVVYPFFLNVTAFSYLSMFLPASQGIFELVVFCLNPTFTKIFRPKKSRGEQDGISNFSLSSVDDYDMRI